MKRIVAALLLGCAVAPANALSFMQSVQFGPGPTDYNSSSGVPLTIALFNSGAGTLTSVTFSSTYAFDSTITVTNTSQSASTGNARTQSGAQFASNYTPVTQILNAFVNNYNDPVDGNTVQFGSSVLTPIAYDLRGTRSSFTLDPGGSTSFGSTGSGATGPLTTSTATALSAFTATGTTSMFRPLFTTLSGLVVSQSGGNSSAQQTTTATGTLSITYNYDAPAAVPEAASWAMMVVGFGVTGAAMRRRKVNLNFA